MSDEDLRDLWVTTVARCQRIVGDRVSAEDCAQEAFAAAFATAGDARPRDIGAWITRVAKRRAVDELRSRTRDRALRARAEVRATADARTVVDVDAVADVAEARWVAAQLSELPATTQAVLRALQDGASLDEAAQTLSLSYRSVESHLTRARRRARGLLAAGLALVGWTARAARRPAAVLAPATVAVALLLPGAPAGDAATPREVVLDAGATPAVVHADHLVAPAVAASAAVRGAQTPQLVPRKTAAHDVVTAVTPAGETVVRREQRPWGDDQVANVVGCLQHAELSLQHVGC